MQKWIKIQNADSPSYISNDGFVKTDSYTFIFKGRNKNCPERLHKLTVDKFGYKTVRLKINKRSTLLRVHRLVAAAFIPNPQNKPYVNHIDYNPSNNHVSNLEWCTQKENIQHSLKLGRMKINNAASKPVRQMDMDGKTLNEFPSSMEAGRILNLNEGNISRCANGTRATAFGFKWEFI